LASGFPIASTASFLSTRNPMTLIPTIIQPEGERYYRKSPQHKTPICTPPRFGLFRRRRRADSVYLGHWHSSEFSGSRQAAFSRASWRNSRRTPGRAAGRRSPRQLVDHGATARPSPCLPVAACHRGTMQRHDEGAAQAACWRTCIRYSRW
jgi:hypothetical protein